MTDYSQISKFFETEHPLNTAGLAELLSLFTTQTYPKGHQLLLVDTAENQLRFLNKGRLREYYSTPEKETNINFYIEPQFITDLSAFMHDTTTKRYQEALTDIEVLSIKKHQFRNLLAKYECGKSFINDSLQKLLKHKELLEFNRITKSPEELYKELFIYKPKWLAHIPQYHIASYLNITPETLSRIRKRIS